MSILVKDFVPAKVSEGMYKSEKVQNFEEVITAMNQWIHENRDIEVLNIETVVLPNIHAANEEGSQDTELGTTDTSNWYQLLRLWYRKEM